MAEIEIGMGKAARNGYRLDEVEIVPSRRTRSATDVDISWQIDAYQFETPVISAALDGVTSPATAIEMDRLGGLGALNAEGLWTRYEDPTAVLERIASLEPEDAVLGLRDAYSAPVKPELIGERVREIRDAGAAACVTVSPARTEALLAHIVAAEPHMLLIQGTVTSAEHLSNTDVEPLDLKYLVRRLDVPVIVGGCSSYPAALHLMRTGAAGVLVGVGSAAASTTTTVLGVGNPQATAIADARAARMRHLDETGVYCHVIADGGDVHRWRHRQGRRVRCRRGDARRTARGCHRGARRRSGLVDVHPASHAAPRGFSLEWRRSGPWRRSCSVPRTAPTGGPT